MKGTPEGVFVGDVVVRIPPALFGRTGGRRSVPARGATVDEVLANLEDACPGLRFHILHETGELRPFVNIFLETENIRFLQGLQTPVPAGATLHVIHSVAGG
jgi:sulfur-carrier protein